MKLLKKRRSDLNGEEATRGEVEVVGVEVKVEGGEGREHELEMELILRRRVVETDGKMLLKLKSNKISFTNP